MIIAPIALMIAVAHVLNKLGNNSELIVMNAAGMPPWLLFRPFLAVGIVVSLLVAAISVYVSPWGLRELRRWATEVRADLVGNIVQPGRFTKIEDKLTLHIRERKPNGQLLGIFIDDQRDPKERATILAEHGDIVKNERGMFLVLENGSVQRHETGQRDPAIVLFNSYALRPVALTEGPAEPPAIRCASAICGSSTTRPGPTRSSPTSRIRSAPSSTTASPRRSTRSPSSCVTYAYLGAPRTTRQSRTMSLLGAIGVVGARCAASASSG